MTSQQLSNHQDHRPAQSVGRAVPGRAVSAGCPGCGFAESAQAAAGLRRVAVASVAALVVVLTLAVVTAGSGQGDRPHKDTAHNAAPIRPGAHNTQNAQDAQD